MALKKWLPALVLLAPIFAGAQTSFVPGPEWSTDCHPDRIVTGDFDGDHNVDVAVLCLGKISVALGRGDGTFQPPVTTSFAGKTIVTPPLAAADFNRDGKTDLATRFDSGILVFLGTGGGKFEALPPIPSEDNTLVTADLNGDGFVDLISYPTYGPSHELRGHGDGTFSVGALPLDGLNSYIYGLAVTDLNADGNPDFVVSTHPGLLENYQTYIALGRGAGLFSTAKLIATDGAFSIATGDFNGDGKTDFTFGSTAYNPAFLTLLGNGDGTVQPQVTATGFKGPFAAADFNGDGKTDLAQGLATGAVAILISRGDGTFQPIASPVQIGGAPYALAIGDFNGDGKPDIAASTVSGVSILLNTTRFNTLGGVVNAASFARNQAIAPGSLVSIFGTGFASVNAQAASIPLPTSLSGVSVAFNGTPAPVSFVSVNQINAEAPWNASGTVNVVVTSSGTAFAPLVLPIASAAPGIFSLQSGAGQAIAINPDGSLAGPQESIPGVATHPANVGDPLVIFATGLGAVSPSIRDGAASLDAIRNSITTPSVLIAGQQAQVLFAGLSPQFVGVNQINVIVPQLPASGVVSLQISAGGILSTDKVTIAVQKPL